MNNNTTTTLIEGTKAFAKGFAKSFAISYVISLAVTTTMIAGASMYEKYKESKQLKNDNETV